MALRPCRVMHAATPDGGQLGTVTDRDNTASDGWTDTAYCSTASLAPRASWPEALKPQFQRKKAPEWMPHIARGNATRARVRSRVKRPGVLARQARVRRPEMPARARRPHDWYVPRPREDRPG
jgi:hypothetical protein